MLFRSTNRQAPTVSFREALLTGQAPDRGLYWPDTLPTLQPSQIKAWKGQPYSVIAVDLLTPFVKDVIPSDTLTAICEGAYTFEVPLEPVVDRTFIMRLDQGPTASFKDFAARAMARMMSHFLTEDEQQLIILTATSGDTGSAIAQAFAGVPGIDVVILFPLDEVTRRQRKQMTTLGGNITAIAVEGKFDDCQAMVKRAFSDDSLKHLPLSSANSINIGRLLPQMVYYAYAYSQLANDLEPITFVVPSGNFGNMMGACLLRAMGLPIEQIVIAVNANDEVPKFLQSGTYEKIEPSRNCLSNAMNVGHPSNLVRLVELYGGQMDHQGALTELPNLDQLRTDCFAVSISDSETKETIKDVYETHDVLLEPHGAVGFAGKQHYLQANPQAANDLIVVVETAHPAKFPEAIEELLQFEPEVPPSLSAIEAQPEFYETLPNDYDSFVTWLQNNK